MWLMEMVLECLSARIASSRCPRTVAEHRLARTGENLPCPLALCFSLVWTSQCLNGVGQMLSHQGLESGVEIPLIGSEDSLEQGFPVSVALRNLEVHGQDISSVDFQTLRARCVHDPLQQASLAVDVAAGEPQRLLWDEYKPDPRDYACRDHEPQPQLREPGDLWFCAHNRHSDCDDQDDPHQPRDRPLPCAHQGSRLLVPS
jgi:hypothetical protein